MPVEWTINHPDRLVTVAMVGSVEPEDVERYLAEVAAAGGMPYAKIIDLSFAAGDLRLAELKVMMRCAEQYAKTYTLGPLAIVVGCDLSEETSAFYGERTKAERPFHIFREMSEALAWLAHSERRGNEAAVQPSH